ncbi:MAG: tetratricopeptide repeat protein, partial [Actinomycetota bacterium]
RGAPPSDLALAFLWLARAEEAEGDRAAAAEHLERALALKPDDPALRVELLDMVGELATERADLDRATAVYEEARSVEARLAEVLKLAGRPQAGDR